MCAWSRALTSTCKTGVICFCTPAYMQRVHCTRRLQMHAKFADQIISIESTLTPALHPCVLGSVLC